MEFRKEREAAAPLLQWASFIFIAVALRTPSACLGA